MNKDSAIYKANLSKLFKFVLKIYFFFKYIYHQKDYSILLNDKYSSNIFFSFYLRHDYIHKELKFPSNLNN